MSESPLGTAFRSARFGDIGIGSFPDRFSRLKFQKTSESELGERREGDGYLLLSSILEETTRNQEETYEEPPGL